VDSLFPLRASDVPANTGTTGWVYVLSNYAIPGCVKIGYTAKGLHDRIRKLQGQTANPGLFLLELFYRTESVQQHEAGVFEVMKEFRWNRKREFFAGPPSLAYYKLKEYFAREPDWIRSGLKQALQL
jgi:hypothetical protein